MKATPTDSACLDANTWREIIARAPLEFEVISDSMRPTFQRGERVLIRPLQDGEPLPGQVIAFHRGMLVTHRYLGRGRCRGDNTVSVDRDIAASEMVGVVRAVLRHGREQPIARNSRLRMFVRYLRLRLSLLRRGRA